MYHRVADRVFDPWGISVAPSRFEEQMRTLKARRFPLSMGDFVSRLDDGTLPPQAVAVTFDDGYVDNLLAAKPVLEELGIPATVFLPTGFVGKQEEYWWDELARLILGRHAAADGTIVIAGRSFEVHLPAVLSGGQSQRSTWRAWEPPRTARERLYIELWRALQVLAHDARRQGMDEVRRFFCRESGNVQESASECDFPMNTEEVRRLVAGDCIEIGAHSETHEPLTTLAPAAQRRQIEQSRAACQKMIGKSIEGFAYPHGDRDTLTKDLVRDSGFRWACSTHREAVDRAHFDVFDLPRFQVLNWTSRELEGAIDSVAWDA
jgi:peptidoglycan/xylan/chitin deacetylase (PgdA/CDA1 family)